MENKYVSPEDLSSKLGSKQNLYKILTVDCRHLLIIHSTLSILKPNINSLSPKPQGWHLSWSWIGIWWNFNSSRLKPDKSFLFYFCNFNYYSFECIHFVNLFLPPYEKCTISFLKDILSKKKLVSSMYFKIY